MKRALQGVAQSGRVPALEAGCVGSSPATLTKTTDGVSYSYRKV
jgi:hypothetical protein